jgi:hypothetical protein
MQSLHGCKTFAVASRDCIPRLLIFGPCRAGVYRRVFHGLRPGLII